MGAACADGTVEPIHKQPIVVATMPGFRTCVYLSFRSFDAGITMPLSVSRSTFVSGCSPSCKDGKTGHFGRRSGSARRMIVHPPRTLMSKYTSTQHGV